jgi:hypothetical protein
MALRRADQAYRRGVRLCLTISPQASAMLDELLASGLYGINGRAGVAQELIYRALRESEMNLLRALRERSKK